VEERALAISERVRRAAEDIYLPIDSISTDDTDFSSDVVAGDRIIMSVTEADAAPLKRPRQEVAKEYAEEIRAAIRQHREDYSRDSIISGVVYTVIATVILFALLLVVRKLFQKAMLVIEERYKSRIGSIHIQSFQIVRAERVHSAVTALVNSARIILIVLLVYTYLNLALTFFPWTRPFAAQLLGYVLMPLRAIALGILGQIPNLFFLAVLVLVTRYFLKLMHLFFSEVEKGTITLSGFYPEWAKMTDRVCTFVIVAFVAVVAFPYIPGSESPAFKGISIFIGILFSLGSQSAVSNFIAGLALTYRRAFKVGDRVKIADFTGDVTNIRLGVTQIRTIKNENIVVPNGTILNSHVINYSSLAKDVGLILHTTVTIGYDAPWRQVHALLLMAADKTAGLLKEPKPYVLQKSLDDFYVSYELNAYTTTPEQMAPIYSELHQNIQDAFNEYGVQIMSPNYEADRDVPTFVPKERWYEPPAKPPLPDEGQTS
jgi:small-conductance mechanosensitive channel